MGINASILALDRLRLGPLLVEFSKGMKEVTSRHPMISAKENTLGKLNVCMKVAALAIFPALNLFGVHRNVFSH